MSGNFAIKGGGVGRLMANAILNFHFDYLNPSLTESEEKAHSVNENGLFLTLGSGTSSARNENLRPLLNRNIPLISGKNGLRNPSLSTIIVLNHCIVFFSLTSFFPGVSVCINNIPCRSISYNANFLMQW